MQHLWKTPGFETNDLGYIREADQVITVLWAGYNQWEPKGIYRRFNVGADVYSSANFGGDFTGTGFEWNGSMNFKNYWSAWTGGNLNSSSLSTTMLRGGPMMKDPGNMSSRIGFSTDYRKKMVAEISLNGTRGNENYSRNVNASLSLSYKPTNYIVITLSPGYNKSYSDLQYVEQVTVNGNDKYIFASIDRKTINTSFRVNLNLSPNLTFQYWGQPFVATGKYYDHKIITDPMADNYSSRFTTFTTQQIAPEDDHYNIDENMDGTIDYSFDKRDFNVREFLSNLVIRWEYNPGSSVYLVWSQTRSSYNEVGNLDVFNDLGDLFNGNDNKPHNVFLVKFSYRFGLK